MGEEVQVDWRTRVAAERRERTRAKLLECALLVFSRKGPQAAVIDDVLALAGMSRGSFYNYFRTNEELLVAVAGEIGNELLRIIDPVVQPHEDPAARIACGARLLMQTVHAYPLLGAFLARLPMPDAESQLIGIAFLARDLEQGLAQRRFMAMPARVALDFVVGVLFSAARSLSRGTQPASYPDDMALAMLLGLGLPQEEARRVAALPLPAIAIEDSSIIGAARHYPAAAPD
ncbi:TetR/AcrR family transcriptional regulator [Duganella sp. LX20W]|uniref:TetR/AcrR family transcriptional regulator n=1 Tax=Rugamonas brunnea TaxID=2758569 RepID=A0A7W2EV37_9BURK|nr:TetR/AcrR family transcriptional regulator [Rugamonas brunnea]MBA5639140.1 TetR/AcrR family transcriptional regulator [Rugamonas brunnea]